MLTLLLGFAIAVQVRANSSGDSLSGLREDDLIGILDDQNARADRLRQQIAGAAADAATAAGQRRPLGRRARSRPGQQAQALGHPARHAARHRARASIVTVTDPQRAAHRRGPARRRRGTARRGRRGDPVRRRAGEHRQRVQRATASVQVDGTPLTPPYRVLAIGDPKTLDTALNIPGGVAATIRTEGGDLVVAERPAITITAVRGLPKDTYATPAPATSSGH